MPIHEFNDENFDKEVAEHNGLVLVDFSATWCGPCKMLQPVLEELSEEMTDVKFGKVDVDDSPNVAANFGVRGVPLLIAIKGKEEIDRMLGSRSKNDIKTWLSNVGKEA